MSDAATTSVPEHAALGRGDLLTNSDLRRLLAVVTQLNAVADPQALLTSIIETAADLLDCEAASLLLYDDVSERLRFMAATGTDTATLAQLPVPLHGSIAGEIYRSGTPVSIRRVGEDARHYDEVGRQVNFDTEALLGVPMRIEGQVVGVLEALNKRGGDFDRRDEHLLALLGDQMAVTLRNVRQREALREAYERLAQIEATKSNFLMLTSHELRTPLGTIRGFASMLRDDADSDDARDCAALIVEAADRMREVVNVMSELNEVRLRRVHQTQAAVDVARLLERARRAITPRAEAKGLAVALDPVPAGLSVVGDAARLERALGHLLTNAVTFTPEGGRVTLRARADGDGVAIEVEDTGCGIADVHLEAVFQEYFQVESALTRSHGGLGLGLTVVRGVAELHGGRVRAESRGEGRGATFSLWLPASGVLGAMPLV